MNGDHVVKNEIDAVKGMALATLNGKEFGQVEYREFCRRMNRIDNCFDCLTWVIEHMGIMAKCMSGSNKE